MKIDVNQLAEHFAHTPFQVEGVYRYAENPGVPYADYTDSFPDLCFHLQERLNLNLMARLISFRLEKLCMGVQK